MHTADMVLPGRPRLGNILTLRLYKFRRSVVVYLEWNSSWSECIIWYKLKVTAIIVSIYMSLKL